jgi:hypothetical protein
MIYSAHISSLAPIIIGIQKPVPGYTVGYVAIIQKFSLEVPFPIVLTMVAEKNQNLENEVWRVLPISYLPEDNSKLTLIYSLYNHLVFALKYEGVNLLVFSKLVEILSEKEILDLVNIEPTGQYSRRIWFLMEWITGKPIKGKNDLSKKSYVPVVDSTLQYAVSGIKSPRHLVLNNLPGTNKFCPLIAKSKKLEGHIQKKYQHINKNKLSIVGKDILQRASAFLLLKDSKASFTIEGESPKSKRAARWGNAIGQAGLNELTKDELVRLQDLVIDNGRFIHMGLRVQGGFVGEHDRITGEPIPDHISAKYEDLDELIDGLIEANKILINDDFDAVLAATIIAFGFVFIHPFEDGNGRIHRYLIHHLLAKKKFVDQGIIFPVSASILDHITDYRLVLESYSKPLLEFIEWKETSNHNVSVVNNTKDFYKFFDATKQAEFLFDCVEDTVVNIIPDEIKYLSNYDAFKRYLEEEFEMPDKLIATLVRFLEQNNGVISKRAREKEFSMLELKEIKVIEDEFKSIFM